ncbi:putative F-box-like domain superfamily protein [Helianthus anomalus]
MKAQRLDIITTLLQIIIETILCFLPIEEATRTSILSREWRYKWTTIPMLVFLEDSVKEPNEERRLSSQKQMSDLECVRRYKDMRCKLFYAIYQVLLLHQGPIQEFTLMTMNAPDTCFEIDQIILHLSRNHTV